ncbi:MAG: hypothetical protein IJN80_00030 [Clostridia bacterium]|nr:hypothetical protein [Clostridia bacterium]
MKRFTAILLAMVLLLCGCSVEWEGTAAPDTAVEDQPQGEKEEPSKEQEAPAEEKGEGKKEDTAAADKKEDTDSEKEQQTETIPAIDQEEIGTLAELYEVGWSAGDAFLYGDTAYYHVENQEYAYLYSLKLGEKETPQYFGKGTLSGLYGSVLVGSEDGRYFAIDLKAKKLEKIFFSGQLQETVRLQWKNQLLIFGSAGEKNYAQMIDLEKLSEKRKKISVKIADATVDGDIFYYSAQTDRGVEFYRGDLLKKTAEKLHTAKEGFGWEQAGERVLFHKNGENPYVLELESMEIRQPKIFECTGQIPGFNPSTYYPRLEQRQESIAYINTLDGLWAYDIAKDQGADAEEIPNEDRQYLANGGYYTGGGSGASHTFRVYIDGKEQTAYLNGHVHTYLKDANQYGMIAATSATIFSCRWDEGETFTAHLFRTHPAPK